MIRILMLNYEFPPLGGGTANANYYLLKEFSKKDNLKIDLVTASTSHFKEESFSDNISIHFLDIGKKQILHYQSLIDLIAYSWKAYCYSKKLMQRRNFDLIHAFFGIPCGYIAMKLGLPYLVSLRGSDVPFYNERFKLFDQVIFTRLSKKIWKNAKYVVANSEGLKKLALGTNPDQSISIVYNGVDTDEFKPLGNKPNNEKIRLISIGRLIARKGYKHLIEALESMENISLTLIGDGNIKPDLMALAKRKKVEIEFLGLKSHQEIPGYLQSSDVFILPSLNEGMSNAILEAMACGLPVIATDVGGSRELVKGNGFIVPRGSSEELAKAVQNYLQNKDLIREHGLRSRELAENMGWDSISQQYLAVYIS